MYYLFPRCTNTGSNTKFVIAVMMEIIFFIKKLSKFNL